MSVTAWPMLLATTTTDRSTVTKGLPFTLIWKRFVVTVLPNTEPQSVRKFPESGTARPDSEKPVAAGDTPRSVALTRFEFCVRKSGAKPGEFLSIDRLFQL